MQKVLFRQFEVFDFLSRWSTFGEGSSGTFSQELLKIFSSTIFLLGWHCFLEFKALRDVPR